jgi:hypothetical protein
MATSGGIEFNDDEIDPQLDLDSQGDMEGSFEDLPPEATDFDVFEFDNLIEPPEDVPTIQVTQDDLKTLEKNLEKIVDRELKKIQKEAKDIASAEKKAVTKENRREIQDDKRAARREKRSLTTDATRRRTDIHSDATSAKIATYSLAAAVGLPGYVIASIANRLLIDPAVDKDIEAERNYSDELVDYFNNIEDELIQKQRDLEDDRDSIEPANIERQDVEKFVTSKGKKPSVVPQRRPSSPTTNTTFTPSSPNSTSGVSQGPPTTTPPVINTPSPSGGGQPTVPTRGFNPSSMVAGAGIVTAAVEASQLVKRQVTAFGEGVQGATKDLFNESPINYIANNTERATKALDPLGVNFPQEAFNQAVQNFATSVETFGKFTDKDIAFSPETLSVSVEGSIDKLVKNMEIAERTDPQKAALKESMNQLDLIWSEFKADFFVGFAPFISRTLEVIAAILTAIRDVISTIHTLMVAIDAGLRLWFPLYGTIMNQLVKNTARQTTNKINSLAKELEEFHNPGNFPIRPKDINRRNP